MSDIQRFRIKVKGPRCLVPDDDGGAVRYTDYLQAMAAQADQHALEARSSLLAAIEEVKAECEREPRTDWAASLWDRLTLGAPYPQEEP